MEENIHGPTPALLPWPKHTSSVVKKIASKGLFLTGIENSDPIVGDRRRNQLREAHDFYQHYRERLQRIKHMGITWIRFGPAYSETHIAHDTYDFTFTDQVLAACSEIKLKVVADLLHFGLPDWMHGANPDNPYFQNNQFPEEFAWYARAFAERYPHIRYFTPVNEPFVTAMFSAKLGIWNEQKRQVWHDDRDFVNAAYNIARAAILARREIEAVWKEQKRAGHPVFVQNESFEKALTTAGNHRMDEADRFNMRRFVATDLIFGHRDEAMKMYLVEQGLSAEKYEWCMKHAKRTRTILGIDHYPTCIHTYERDNVVDHDPTAPYQLYSLVKEYWERYPLPLLHLEVNGWPEHAVNLCMQTFNDMQRLKTEGYPVVGMSWFGDEYQVGWYSALAGPHGNDETPVGLHYKGEIQPVGHVFSKLAKHGFK